MYDFLAYDCKSHFHQPFCAQKFGEMFHSSISSRKLCQLLYHNEKRSINQPELKMLAKLTPDSVSQKIIDSIICTIHACHISPLFFDDCLQKDYCTHTYTHTRTHA